MNELVEVPRAGELETNPVEYMAVVLNRAKGWLAEAQSIDAVRETKAIAVGYESVIREKELAMDAELSATEIVRRCERRIGELVREGQRNGEIRSQDDTHSDRHRRPDGDLKESPHEAAGLPQSTLSEHYTMSDVSPEEFEDAVAEARDEGNLSRANVLRKVKGESKPKADRSEWHHKSRRLNSDRILTSLAAELDAATSGLDLMDRDDLDAELVAELVPEIRESLRTINRHLRRVQQ